MKVLMANGSTRRDGCTQRALAEIADVLALEGFESGIMQLGALPMRD